MATSAGVASDLLGRLEAAAGGTVDDLVLAGGASRLMAGQSEAMARALGNAAPELVTISRAMAKLSPTVGDSTDAFEALTEAMQTGRTRGLQQWGFDITKIKDDQDLLNQVLDQGRGLVNDLGGDVESATDKYAEFEQGIDNLNDAFVTFLNNSKVTSAVIGGLTQNLNDTNTIIALHEQGVISTTDAWRLWAGLQIPSEINATKAELEALVTATAEQERETQRLLNATTSATQAQSEANATGEAAITTYSEMALAYRIAANALDLQAENTYKAYVSSEKFADRLALVNEKSAEATEKLHDLTPKVEELADTLNQDVGSPLTQFIADIQFFMASGGRNFTKELEAIQNRLAEKIAAEETTPGQAAIAMQDAREEAARLLIDYAKVQVELGKETDTSAIENIAEALGITRDEATKLFTDFDKNADAVFGEERAVNINTASLETLHEKLLAAEGDITSLGEKAKSIEGTYDINFEIHTNGEIPNVGGYGGGHPTGPTTPTASLRVGDTAPTPAGTDWQAVFMSLTEEQRRKVQDMVGTSMYESDYAAAITKVLKNADLNDAARKLDRGGGRTVPRGDAPFDPGGLGGVPLPFSGGGNLAAGGNTIIVMIDGQEVAYRMQTLAGQSLRVASMSGAGMLGQ